MKTVTFTYVAGTTTTNEITVKDFSIDWEQVLWGDDEVSITGFRRNRVRAYQPTITLEFEHDEQLRTVIKEIYDTLQDGEVFIDGDGYYLSVVPEDFSSTYNYRHQIRRKPSRLVLKGDLTGTAGNPTGIPFVLEPGPNFQVLTDQEPPDFDAADDDIFYVLMDDGLSASDSYTIKKYEGDTGDPSNPTELASYNIDLTSFAPTRADEADIIMRWDGKIVLMISDISPGWALWVFDQDLNLETSLNQAIDCQITPIRLEPDYDNSVYVMYRPDSGETGGLAVRKYDKDLNILWTSDEFPNETENWNPLALGVTQNFVVQVVDEAGENNNIRFLDKSTGDQDSTFARGYRSGTRDSCEVLNLSDGRFAILELNSGELSMYLYSADGTQTASNTFDTVTDGVGANLARRNPTVDANDLFVIPFSNDFYFIDDTLSVVDELLSAYSASLSKIHRRSDPLKYVGRDGNTIELYDTNSGASPVTDFLANTFGTIATNLSFAKSPENWNLQVVDTGTPTITNVSLSASPSTDTVPFTSTISFSADNTGDANVTLLLTLDGTELTSLEIPAGGSASDTYDYEFKNPGTYTLEFAGSSATVTANGDTVSGGFEGWIDVNSAAQSDVTAKAPEASIFVLNTPSANSDCSGGTEFNVEWNLTDYCILITSSMTKSSLATAVSGDISSNVTGLSSSAPGANDDGDYEIRVYSDTDGTDDNGERVIFGVPSSLEGNGGIFNKYEVFLAGGVDELTVSATIDIIIGGSTFATTSTVTADETDSSIATKIYDACVAVGSGTYSFARNGTRVLVGSSAGAESLALDIGNAGFNYETQNIVAV